MPKNKYTQNPTMALDVGPNACAAMSINELLGYARRASATIRPTYMLITYHATSETMANAQPS